MKINQMKLPVIFVIAYLCYGEASPIAKKNVTLTDAYNYLTKYKYISQNSNTGGSSVTDLKSPEELSEAIKDLQCTWGLKETGDLDEATIELMNKPRCGVPDNHMMCRRHAVGRKRRYLTAEQKWPRKSLTYKVNGYSPDLPRNIIDSDIEKAFKLWTDASQLTISKQAGKVDMDMNFHHGDHGDGAPFDGPSGTLAHAFFPGIGDISGDMHFDDAEKFTKDSYEGVNFLWVAAHEAGHALGLEHSNSVDALMAPFYQGYNPDTSLRPDDIAGIQRLYGKPVKNDETGEDKASSDLDEICHDSRIDAITRTKDGTVYIFKGKVYYELKNGKIFKGLTANKFKNAPTFIDAALYNARNGWTLLIEGTNWFGYKNDEYIGRGDLRKIVKDIPYKMSSIFYYPSSNDLFITHKSFYYKLTSLGVARVYPKKLSSNNFPHKIDAAFTHPNGKLYLFNGDKYYEFDSNADRINKSGHTGADWFNCNKI